MGMYDSYEPSLPCPRRGGPTKGYQGKGGPCALLEFREGKPTLARDSDDRPCETPRRLDRLPDTFSFYGGSCTRCGFGAIEGVGFAEHGVWVRSELDTEGNTATRVHPECALCDECGEAITTPVDQRGVFCPGCKRMVSVLDDAAV